MAELSQRKPVTTAAPPQPTDSAEVEIQGELAKLSEADRQAALAQRFCVVLADSRLGSMGTPNKLVIDGKTVFVCCEGCKEEALADPQKTLARLTALQNANPPAPSDETAPAAEDSKSDEAEVATALAKLSKSDQAIAMAQRTCVVLEGNRLGSMGTPIKVMIEGQPVFLCCEGCKKKALANPKATLSKAAKLKSDAAKR